MGRRLDRVNVLLRQELSNLLLRELKDPRIADLVTITHVDTSPDLRLAHVYVSVMGSAEEKSATMKALQAGAAYLRRALVTRLTIRRVPALNFRLDESMQEAAHVLDLLQGLGGSDSSP